MGDDMYTRGRALVEVANRLNAEFGADLGVELIACPVTITGGINGLTFYFRARGDFYRIDIGDGRYETEGAGSSWMEPGDVYTAISAALREFNATVSK